MIGWRSLGLLTVVALSARCGDPVWDASYEGDIVVVLDCTYYFTVEGGGPRDNEHLEVGLVWLLDGDPEREAVGQPTHDAGAWPTSRLRLFHPPPAEAVSVRDGLGRVALGQILAYDDTDGDRVWSDGEHVRAISSSTVFVYAPPPREGDPPAAFAPGFHVTHTLPCEAGRTSRVDTAGGHPGCLIEPAPAPPELFFRESCAP